MAGETLFRRRVKVALATAFSSDFSTVSALVTEIDQLRVSFRVSKALTKDPNTCEVKIWNLSADTRAKLPDTGAKLLLRAGYETTEEQLFIGDARTIESKPDGADWVTTIRCGDGERAINYARAVGSFAENTQVADVVRALGKAAKIDNGNLEKAISGIPSSLRYTQGYAVQGPALKELDRALKLAGLEWSIQDNALLILKDGETTTEEVIELSEDSGLIGIPEVAAGEKKSKKKAAGKPVIKAKSLLQGGLRCGRKVQLRSVNYNGLYRIVKVDHAGDTNGGQWDSSLEMEVQ